MKKDIKHILNITEADGARARAEKKAADMEVDSRLAANARLRLGDVKLEKWWSVAAGMALIAAFILYTCYLTIPAAIILVLLAAFIIYVFTKLHRERKRVENTEPEISPNRCISALVNKALGNEITGRDVTSYMDHADIAAFGAQLKSKLATLGLDSASVTVKADAKVTETDQLTEKCGTMPVSVILDCAGTKVELKWNATFALPSTGDCMPDTKLTNE